MLSGDVALECPPIRSRRVYALAVELSRAPARRVEPGPGYGQLELHESKADLQGAINPEHRLSPQTPESLHQTRTVD